jgi:GTPase
MDGQLDNGRGQARLNLLRHRHELVSGRTSSISHGFLGFDKAGEVVNYETCGSIQEICEVSVKLVTLIDLAGHRKYLKTTVFGLTAYQPELAMLVVGTDTQIDEATCDQVCFSIALGMPLFVVVTKVDKSSADQVAQTTQAIVDNLLAEKGKVPLLVQSSSDVHTAAQHCREGKVAPVFHISCVTGHNLPLLQRFLYHIPVETTQHQHELLSQQPAEFHVDELFNVEGVGLVLGGILRRGVVQEGEVLLIGPMADGEFTRTAVRSIRFRINRAPCQQIVAGQAATITVAGVDRASVRKVRPTWV